jgi:hypothetical protein
MASVGGMILGLTPSGYDAAGSFANFTINSKTSPGIDRLAWSLQMPPDIAGDTITHIGLRYGVRSGTPVAHDIGFQGWGTDGLPDGTFLGGGSPNKGPFTPPADTTWNSTWQWIALTNSYATSRGEQLMIVLEPTGEPDGSNNSSFTRSAGFSNSGISRNFAQTNGAAWSSPANTFPVIAVKSATRVYGHPMEATFSTNMGTAGHRQCNLLTIPSGCFGSLKVIGLEFIGLGTAAGSVILGAWNAAGTSLTEVTIDTDRLIASAARSRVYFDDSPVTLTAGTAYYFGMEYVDVACRIAGFDVDAAADMAAYPFGTACYAASWNGSAWTETNIRRHQINLIVDDITGGGGKIWELDVSA